jgi:5'-3' exonuclease
MNYLLIDVSYYNFYRFYATTQWYKNAHSEEEIEPGYDWSENIVFMEKFTKMFKEHIKKYTKKFKIGKIFLLRDCKRDSIWRMAFYPGYKGTRDAVYAKNKFMGGKVFKKCYSDIIPTILSDNVVQLKMPQLEGDDLIYLTTNKLLKKNPDANIFIISSDHDLLQIIDGKANIELYTANLKCYNNKSKGNSDLDCFCKAILGDTSDNIPKVIKRLGEKTALKLYNDKDLLMKKFSDNPGSFKQYSLNRLLVDFKYIPAELVSYYNKHTTVNA